MHRRRGLLVHAGRRCVWRRLLSTHGSATDTWPTLQSVLHEDDYFPELEPDADEYFTNVAHRRSEPSMPQPTSRVDVLGTGRMDFLGNPVVLHYPERAERPPPGHPEAEAQTWGQMISSRSPPEYLTGVEARQWMQEVVELHSIDEAVKEHREVFAQVEIKHRVAPTQLLDKRFARKQLESAGWFRELNLQMHADLMEWTTGDRETKAAVRKRVGVPGLVLDLLVTSSPASARDVGLEVVRKMITKMHEPQRVESPVLDGLIAAEQRVRNMPPDSKREEKASLNDLEELSEQLSAITMHFMTGNLLQAVSFEGEPFTNVAIRLADSVLIHFRREALIRYRRTRYFDDSLILWSTQEAAFRPELLSSVDSAALSDGVAEDERRAQIRMSVAEQKIKKAESFDELQTDSALRGLKESQGKEVIEHELAHLKWETRHKVQLGAYLIDSLKQAAYFEPQGDEIARARTVLLEMSRKVDSETSCLADRSESEVFKPRAERKCQDLLFFLALVAATCGSFAVFITTLSYSPHLMTDLVDPPDSYGNNCGRGLMADKTKLVYPRLDADFHEQSKYVLTGQWWKFEPTSVCAESCPGGFNLASPTKYGGPSYPCSKYGDGCVVPEFFYTFRTRDIIDRCLPTADTAPAHSTDLCVVPNCTSPEAAALSARHPGSVSCAAIDSQPAATNTWEVCPVGCDASCCADHRRACEGEGTLQVRQDTSEAFVPHVQTEEDAESVREWSKYVSLVLGGYEGLVVSEGVTALTVFGLVLPLVMAFVWAAFLWLFAGVVVYVLIFLLVLFLLILDFVLMIKAGFFEAPDTTLIDELLARNATAPLVDIPAAEGTWKEWFMALAVISSLLTVVVIIFLVLNRRCIARLIAILQETTKIFRSHILIVVWPAFDLGLQAAVFVFGFFAIYFAANAPDSLFSTTDQKFAAFAFHVLVAFWLSQFVRATTWTSISAAICRWYVTENAVNAEQTCCGFGLGLKSLAKGTCLVVTKHLGSMAFGSLIIALMQLVRAIVMYVDYCTQSVQEKSCLLRYTMRCVQCCLTCIQRTIEMISYYAFVYVAMRGEPFCYSCRQTFKFITKYSAQTVINKSVTYLLNLLIGWSTPVLAAVCTFCYLEYSAGDYAHKYNTLWAAAVVFLIAFIVTTGITLVYDCAIDTIYLCAFKDMEENQPPKFMSNDLRRGFGLDEAEAEAEQWASFKSTAQREREAKAAGSKTMAPSPAALGVAQRSNLGVEIEPI